MNAKRHANAIIFGVFAVVYLALSSVLACHAGTLQTLYFTVPVEETAGECNWQWWGFQADSDRVTVVLQATGTYNRQFYLQLDDVPRGVRQRVSGWGMPGGTWTVTSKVIERVLDTDPASPTFGQTLELTSCWGNRINAISFGF